MMGLIQGLRRALTYQQVWGSDADWDDSNTTSGQRVDSETALTLAAVWASVRLLSNTVATLPVGAYRRRGGQRLPYSPRPLWLDTPVPVDPNLSRAAHMTQVVASMALDGNAFILAAPDIASAGALYVLNPRLVDIEGGLDDAPVYRVRAAKGGGSQTFSAEQMLHIPYITLPGERRGYDPIKAYRQSIGHGLAVQEFGSKFFADGAAMSGLITVPGPPPAQEVLDQLRSDFKRKNAGRRNSHAVGILTGGAGFTQLSISPENAQFIETARWTAEQVAMVFGIPPHMLGLTEANASYASVEQKATEYVEFSVRPYLERIEAAYARLLDGNDSFIKFNIDGLLRGDQKARYEAYSTGIQGGFLTYDDIRRWEDLQPLAGGDKQRVPLALSDPEMADLKDRVDVAANLVNAGYDPARAAQMVGLDIKHLGLPPQSVQPANIQPDAGQENDDDPDA